MRTRRLKQPLVFIVGNLDSAGLKTLGNAWIEANLDENLETEQVWYYQTVMFTLSAFESLDVETTEEVFQEIHEVITFEPAPFREKWIAVKFGNDEWFQLHHEETSSNIYFWCKDQNGGDREFRAMEEFYLSMALSLFYGL